MGVVSVTTFTSDTETVTRTKLNGLAGNLLTEFNGNIDNSNIASDANIALSKLATTGDFSASTISVTSSDNENLVDIDNDHTWAALYIHQDIALANGKNCVLIESTVAQDTATSQLVKIVQYTGSDQDCMLIDNDGTANGLTIQQATTGCGLVLTSSGNGPHIRFTGDPTVASPTDGDMWFDGGNLSLRIGTSTKNLTDISVQLLVIEHNSTVSTGDGKFYFHIDDRLDGKDLIGVHAEVIQAGTTGTTDIQIHNDTQSVDMLSTLLTIDSGETGSDTAATPAVINTSNDNVAENDVLRVDIDAVQTVAPKGLLLTLKFGVA